MSGTRRLLGLVIVLVLAAAALAACGSSSNSATSASSSAASSSASTVVSTKATKLGTILVSGSGQTLYASTTSCTGSCLTAWPPLKASGTPKAEGSASASLLGTATGPNGEIIVTYAGHTLYTFVSDTASDPTSGQGEQGFYVVNPAGDKVTATPHNGGQATTGTQTKKPSSAAPGY